MWQRRKGPSKEAIDFAHETERQLEEVRELKAEAQDVSESLRKRRAANHFGLGLEALIRGGHA